MDFDKSPNKFFGYFEIFSSIMDRKVNLVSPVNWDRVMELQRGIEECKERIKELEELHKQSRCLEEVSHWMSEKIRVETRRRQLLAMLAALQLSEALGLQGKQLP